MVMLACWVTPETYSMPSLIAKIALPRGARRIHQKLALDRPVPQLQPLGGPGVKRALESDVSREHRLAPPPPLRERVAELEVERLHALLPAGAADAVAVRRVRGEQPRGAFRRARRRR